MAIANRFNVLAEHLAEGVHNWQAHTLKLMLTNVAPSPTHTVRADLTEIAAGFGYTAGGATVTVTGSGQSGGVYRLEAADVTFTAAGGSIGPFRYAVLYNDTPTSPADPLICWWDYGSAVTLPSGESFVLDVDPAEGLVRIV